MLARMETTLQKMEMPKQTRYSLVASVTLMNWEVFHVIR